MYLFPLKAFVTKRPPLPSRWKGPTKGVARDKPSPVIHPALSESVISSHGVDFLTNSVAPHVNPLNPPHTAEPKYSKVLSIAVVSGSGSLYTPKDFLNLAYGSFKSSGSGISLAFKPSVGANGVIRVEPASAALR